jgi:MFS family permease
MRTRIAMAEPATHYASTTDAKELRMPQQATASSGNAAIVGREGGDPTHARAWWILAVLGLAQLMIVLDITVVNIALPSTQRALHFSNNSREWIVTAYALAFGSLLLAGGRIGDLLGRKRLFIASTIGFAAASTLGGAAQSFGMLVAARGLQGVFAALMAPAALSLVSTTFTDPRERGKAFGVWGGIGGGGAAIGLLLGGVLTQDLSWRWTLFVNLGFAIVAAVGASALLRRDVRSAREPIDVPGTLTATAGLFALVYGFAYAQNHGWGSSTMVACLGQGRCCSRCSSRFRSAPRTRCCRCASCSTATAAGPTWSSASSAWAPSACFCL